MDFKFAGHLLPGDRITLHGSDQTVTRVEQRTGPTAAVFTDFTGDDPWLLDPGAHVTTRPAVPTKQHPSKENPMIHTDRIDYAIAHGTGRLPRKIRLADDTVISVHAGYGAYSTPRPRDRMVHEGGLGTAPADYPGPYTHMEACLLEPLTAPDGWEPYEDFGIYSTVPVGLVRDLVVAHGGEHVAQDEWDDVVKGLGESYLQNRAT